MVTFFWRGRGREFSREKRAIVVKFRKCIREGSVKVKLVVGGHAKVRGVRVPEHHRIRVVTPAQGNPSMSLFMKLGRRLS